MLSMGFGHTYGQKQLVCSGSDLVSVWQFPFMVSYFNVILALSSPASLDDRTM